MFRLSPILCFEKNAFWFLYLMRTENETLEIGGLNFRNPSLFLWVSFALFLIFPLLGFYPWKFRIVFCIFFAAFAFLDFVSPVAAVFLLAAYGPFFGNHPGGRFLELQDCLWIFWSVRGTAEAIRSKLGGNLFFPEEWRTKPAPFLLFAFFGAGALSLAVNPELLGDWIYFRKSWFGFLHSTELEPFYPFKVLGTGILFACGFLSRRAWMDSIGQGNRFTFWFCSGIAFGFFFSVTIGWFEFFFPFVKSKLDAYHLWLDAYKLEAPPHRIFPFSDPILPTTAIQSLFWNRSWFAVYLVSAFPFLFETLFRVFETERFRFFFSRPFAKTCVLFFVLAATGITFLWIGARGGFTSFCILLSAAFFHFVYSKIRMEFRVRKRISVLFSAAIAFTGVLFPIFIVYFAESVDPARLLQFDTGYKIGAAKYLFGGGFESFGWFNECCVDPAGRASQYHTSHNQWIQVFSGMGGFGIFIFVFLWGVLFYERLREVERDGSSLRASFLFGSISAVFVYSFFQEWFYIRSVYFYWIACFLIFSDFSGRNSEPNPVSSRKHGVKFLGATAGVLSIAVVSLSFYIPSFFPTKRYQYGVYQPPASQDTSEVWILEGKGELSVFPRTQRVRIDFETFADADRFASEWSDRKSEKTSLKRGEIWTEYYPIYRSNQVNILKTECVLKRADRFFDTFVFWRKETKDPETRKFCVKVRISPAS
ncbi:O-antigen ligase family protein [Leptospira ellisii]|uniref:O-antigen ligase family protein n=1 Tax=Leptospira ellisii TaxID=2023197 RepID=UPI000C2B16FB|nr:O-antigen ligase family protein [Leptospira ellisii]PKA04720.1 hypothetical protein CH375_09315 [Leptospira ellisii]